MTKSQKDYALSIISASESCKASFNVPIADSYSNTHEILIHECNARLINDLVVHGYSLFMRPKGLSVDFIGNGDPLKQ